MPKHKRCFMMCYRLKCLAFAFGMDGFFIFVYDKKGNYTGTRVPTRWLCVRLELEGNLEGKNLWSAIKIICKYIWLTIKISIFVQILFLCGYKEQ